MVKNILHIIRWPNLVMVAVIQYIIYRQLLILSQSCLSFPDFLLLSLITMLIAASGYVINDYYDAQIDRINRPHRWIAGNTWSLKKVLILYFVIVAAGGFLSILLAMRLSLLFYFLIFPIAILGLWWYSRALKCKPVVGNLWVSLFCAGVVIVVALPDLLLEKHGAIKTELWYYALFAFLTTWYREVIKDLEDLAGDRKADCNTFAVLFGEHKGKIAAMILGILIVAAIYGWDVTQSGTTIRLIFTLLQGSIIASMAFIWWARDNRYFHNASMVIKAVMLGGTLVLLLI